LESSTASDARAPDLAVLPESPLNPWSQATETRPEADANLPAVADIGA